MPKKSETLPDTNVILRYLLQDNPVQFEKAEHFFEAVRTGAQKALLLESVLVECVYVMTKFYQVPKTEATSSLVNLLRYKGIVNQDKEILTDALALFASENIDLVDCVVIAAARRKNNEIFSFDKKLLKLSSRQQPLQIKTGTSKKQDDPGR